MHFQFLFLALGTIAFTLPALCIRICHHNDFQARYVETDASNRFCPANRPSDKCYSSAARIRSAFDLLKCDVRISAGDFSFGTIYWNIYDEEIAIAAYNAIDYDLAIFGIEDVTLGFDQIIKTIQSTPNITWLGINIGLVGARRRSVRLPIAVDRSGICFVSVLTPLLTRLYDYSDDITISDPIRAIRAALSDCRNSNKVVAITHLGFENDIDLCQAVPELDLVIGGFSQRNLARSGSYPRRVRRSDGTTCFVVTAYAFGRQMGFADVKFRDGRVSFDGYGVLPLDGKIEPDRGVARVMESFRRRLGSDNLDKKVATLTGPIPDACVGKECARGNLICDALLDDADEEADVCILNSDYSRGSFARGIITEGDIQQLAQFPNNKSIISTTGQGILDALENGLSANLGDPIAYGQFPQVAGMKVVFDMRRQAGSRVVNVAINDDPLVPSFRYRIVTSSFLGLGNYGYKWEGASNIRITHLNIRDIVEFYLRFNSPYKPVLDGRMLEIGTKA